MFRRILLCITQLWDVLRESLSSLTPQTPHSSVPDSMPYNTTVSQAPSSSASFSTRWDVFLSFHGSDTRNKFTSHLYDKLGSNGIRTFMDDPELCRGEVISDALLDAIRKSKTYIVVLSENYASSSWCLNEVAEILSCYKTTHRLVIPVFYNIDPSIVRRLTGSFKQAFDKHDVSFVGEAEKVKNWQLTLTQLASFAGYHISQDRSEAGVINDIVDELLFKINPKILGVAKFPVGLDSRVEAITTLLSSDTEGVIKFGIYGMGGVGKTTLAKALYNQLLRGRSFKGSCFLANVREISETAKGLVSLQEQLINNVLKSTTKVEVYNVEHGINLIRERISLANVLILIDDIYDFEQYESLAGPFASGSVVIITTRDEEMLDKVGVEPKYRYMLKVLDYAQSRELFTQYAFEKAEPPNNVLALCEDILGLAGGLPLALKIFGSYLSTKKEVGWKSYIETLQQNPNSTIEQKLLISLDALESDDRMLKKIFIDIACFFVGWNIEEAIEVLGTYYSHVDDKMDILKKRCLLTLNEEELVMHDLLRDMGRNVARNKASDEPGKYSRLWLPKDIDDVLKNHKVLHWDCCPLKCLPSDFYPEKLVILELWRSNMKTMWDLNMVSHVFGNLKTLNMSYSQELVTTQDFIKLPSLETLNLEGCESLEEVHMSIGSLVWLDSLNLKGCKKLRSLPDTICNLRALKVLNISECNSLEALPLQLGNIKSLIKLNADGLSVSKLPDSTGHLNKLVKLRLNNNEKLETLPDSICELRSLEILEIDNCSSLEALPTAIGNLEFLKKIKVRGLAVSKLPDSIGSLTKLVELDLSYNKNLETLPDTICNLRSLEILSIDGCLKLETLPDELWKITRLRELDATGAKLLKKLPDIGSGQIALSLQELKLSSSGITALPSGFSQLTNLQSLGLHSCYLLSSPELPPSLKRIGASLCRSLKILPNLSNLKHLETLDLSYCRGLKNIQGLEDLTSIKSLQLEGCSGLVNKHHWKRLFKVYSEFGHEISVYGLESLNQKSRPDWIFESPYWTSGEISKSATVYAHLLPNKSHIFIGIILCFRRAEEYSMVEFGYSVKNTSSGFIWSSDSLDVPISDSLMVIVPKSIFSITDDDNAIELTADSYVKIVGIHLLYKTEEETEDETVEEIEYKTETKTIEDVVGKHVIDIDALKLIDPVLHDIFLDIACFFIGWEKNYVVQILETYYTNVQHNIDILKNRCILKISDRDKLVMNDMHQYLGRKIARDNSPDEPEKHSRLWLLTDIYDVLKKHMGTEVIEGIVPRKVYYGDTDDALTGESFTSETFKKMKKVRFLYLRKVHLTGSFEQTFHDLRWLYWDCCPLKCLPSEFYPPKLVILELRHSNIITMWELNTVPHVFEKLKTLDMSGSEDLTTTPDFTKLPCLQTLHLEGCKSLEEVHISIGSLVRLVSLNLHGCVKLKSLPDTICNLRALEVLDIRDCSCLEALPTTLGNIQSLRELDAGNLTVSVLPDSTGQLNKLVKLRLNSNKNLKILPVTSNLRSLEILDISGCEKLEMLPDQLCTVTSLRELIAGGATLLKKFPHVESSQMTLIKLDFSQSGITALPSSISKLSNLEDLNLKDCHCLLSIPELPCNLKWIRANGCMSMGKLPDLSNLKQLEYLNLEDCSGLTEIHGLKGLISIRTLHLEGCNSSLLDYIFTESFFQIYSEFGHPIQICSTEFPDWIDQSSEYEPTMSSNEDSVPPNESYNYFVENTTSDANLKVMMINYR